MKQLLFLFSISVFFLSSCSMQEEIDLSKEGNGYYQIDVDMSAMLEMMKSMGGSEKMPDSVAKQKKDTTFSLASMIDSVGGNFTPEDKAYFHNGTMHVKMDMPENKMNMVMRFPVKNVMDLKNFFRVWTQVDSLNKIKKQQEQALEQGNDNSMPNMMDPSKQFSNGSGLPVKPSPYIITDSSIERIARSKEEITGDMGEQAQGAAMFMGQISMMTTIKLPRPAKRVEGKNAKLSEDKRSLFFSATMQEMMDDAAAGAFKVIF
ncbi:MAG: hypothetical protein K2X48_17595 [Chitinophagaceae bacterium]|nr:hypothetical protein [Chitinophagaceae bacterium]